MYVSTCPVIARPRRGMTTSCSPSGACWTAAWCIADELGAGNRRAMTPTGAVGVIARRFPAPSPSAIHHAAVQHAPDGEQEVVMPRRGRAITGQIEAHLQRIRPRDAAVGDGRDHEDGVRGADQPHQRAALPGLERHLRGAPPDGVGPRLGGRSGGYVSDGEGIAVVRRNRGALERGEGGGEEKGRGLVRIGRRERHEAATRRDAGLELQDSDRRGKIEPPRSRASRIHHGHHRVHQREHRPVGVAEDDDLRVGKLRL